MNRGRSPMRNGVAERHPRLVPFPAPTGPKSSRSPTLAWQTDHRVRARGAVGRAWLRMAAPGKPILSHPPPSSSFLSIGAPDSRRRHDFGWFGAGEPRCFDWCTPTLHKISAQTAFGSRNSTRTPSVLTFCGSHIGWTVLRSSRRCARSDFTHSFASALEIPFNVGV